MLKKTFLFGFISLSIINFSVAADNSQSSATSSAPAGEQQLYQVKDGNVVDAKTYEGFKTWRALSCDRCHGPNQEGLVGPSLINSLKKLTKDEFKNTVTHGRPEKGMPSFASSQMAMSNLDNLYAYLKGRSDGAITSARVKLNNATQ